MPLHNAKKQHQTWYRVSFKEVPSQPQRGNIGPTPHYKKKIDAYMTHMALENYKRLPEAVTIDKWVKCTQEEIDHLEGRGIPGNLNIPDDVVYDDNTTWAELKLKLAEREARINKSIKEKLEAEERLLAIERERAELAKAGTEEPKANSGQFKKKDTK